VISIQTADFDIAQLYKALRDEASNAGGIACFTGLVREFYEPEQKGKAPAVNSLFLEHYPGMTEQALSDIVAQAQQRWDVLSYQVVHRVGELLAGEQIVFVGVASTHRGDAFAAAEFIMDFLKTRAPFWKKQHSGETSEWIESRASDELARARWDKSS